VNKEKRFKIVILSDLTSWINPTIELLVSHWQESGYEVLWSHSLRDITTADFCFCLSLSKILKREMRNRFRHTLVVHASDLPHGKGWSPLTWQILEGKNRVAVSLFEADDSVDSGPIYTQCHIDFEGYELIDDLRRKLADATYELCTWFVSEYPTSASHPRVQSGVESFYRKRGPADSQLDVNKTIAEQFNLLRVIDNHAYPLFFEWKGRRFVLRITDGGDV